MKAICGAWTVRTFLVGVSHEVELRCVLQRILFHAAAVAYFLI